VFQDGSVKTILTSSHKAPQAGRHPASTGRTKVLPAPPLAPAHPSWPHAGQEVTRDRRLPTYHGEEFISTASASTISSLLTFFPKCFSSFLQYLFAIGFPHLFSLRRSLSPALCTSIKVHDSSGPSRTREDTTDGALTLFGGPLVDTSAPPLPALATVLQITIRRPLDRRLPVWAFPASVARTKGILVSFFPPLNDMLKFSG